jgi:AcrR family transcriptional regulator
LPELSGCFKQLFMIPALAGTTRDRLLAAASELFAERGFHGTKIRDIAERAGVNVASGHYHYGSKKALYLEVLRAQFAEIRAALARRGASPPAAALARLSRGDLESLLRARVKVMLDILLGPPPGLHGTLMQREMCDPSEALPTIVEEFIVPMVREMAEIVSRLAPGLDRGMVERCVFSVMGQGIFYRFAMPAMLHMLGRGAYPPDFARDLAAHITEFSLGGMARVAAGRRAHAR